MKDLQKNIVPATNQNINWFFKYGGEGLKILFVGNSTSKHGPKPSIGWTRDCGMAASCTEKDYVHLVAQKAKEYDCELSFAILQVASFECDFRAESFDYKTEYKKVLDYHPDIVVMLFGTNVPRTYDTADGDNGFEQAYEDMRNYLDYDKKAKFFHIEQFWIRDKVGANRKTVADRYNEPFIYMGDIRTAEETHGEFNHPNDYGMQCIADLIWQNIEPTVKELTSK